MEIHIRPEIEALIREDVERGPYDTVDEFVERAVAMLHEQETWLATHRTEIEQQIAAGYAAAQRGELIEEDEVHSRLDQLKHTANQ
jgi:Arc/MetJ-type ribon-helix-helix transcriptional regulator